MKKFVGVGDCFSKQLCLELMRQKALFAADGLLCFLYAGANVTLDSCYLWDGVVIEDSCVINGAIVCNNVTVYSNTRIQPRTILSTNVSCHLLCQISVMVMVLNKYALSGWLAGFGWVDEVV